MATSINLANMSFTLDVTQLKQGTALTRNEINNVAKVLRESEPAIMKYNRELAALNVAYRAGAMSADVLSVASEKLASKYGVVTEAAKKARDEEEKQIKTNAAHDAALRRFHMLREQVMTGEERHAKIVREHTRDLREGIITQETYNRLIQQSAAKNIGTLQQQSVVRMPAIADKNAAAVGGVMAAAGRFAGPVGVGLLAKESVQLASSAEVAKAAFEVMTGSVSDAKNMVADMRKLDATSPLGFVGIQKAGKTLLGYGVETQRVMPVLRQLSDISMGNEEQFNLLALAYGQVEAAGRLMGQEVRQMINSGFNPLQQISQSTGISMADLKKKMEDGEISVQMFRDAVRDATAEGGRFYGMTERISQTASGAYAKMVSDLQKAGMELGTVMLPAVIQITKGIGELASATTVLTPVVETMANGWGAVAALLRGDIMNYMDQYSERQKEAMQRQAEMVALTEQQAEAVRSVAKAEEEASAEYQKSMIARSAKDREAFEKETQKIDEAYRKQMMGADEFEKMKLYSMLHLSDRTKEDQQRLNDALWQLEATRIAKKNEETKKDAEKEKKRVDEEIKRAKESLANPTDKLRTELDKIAALQKQGMDAGSAFKLRLQAFENFDKSKQKSGSDVSATIAPALKAGSVEAYKFILGQKDKSTQLAQEQLKKQERIAKATEETARAVAGIKGITAARER